ncbi:GCN5-related N-acetyltransferase [Kribbella flavida DSM 17836]|uniref:GCN5-related N-acetyltransferase n=1 Tax=Kribbella flavida (strain DSM 17836 / JCM 10339 / NBRC 14399) TaxID=479435 RepID=D2Q2V7_KRIFD|nr:GNAT family N-acetyltransferase [Kribbella flavida]ADB30288.1 GCN5-related N-acetyltransferase [Kribbella flavida DSM 17836]
MRVEPMDAEGLRLVERWTADDPAGGAVLEFYGQAVTRWAPLLEAPTRAGGLVRDGDEPIGFVDLEILDGEAEIMYYLAPAYRGRGLGHAALALLVDLAREHGAASVHAEVEPANEACAKVLRAAGFTDLGTNQYGDAEFVLALPGGENQVS